MSVVRIINTGNLIRADQVDRLFMPFTRLDDRTHQHGFGLGLALVSSIAKVHGGTVQATAVHTGGLDITVRLPHRESPTRRPEFPSANSETAERA